MLKTRRNNPVYAGVVAVGGSLQDAGRAFAKIIEGKERHLVESSDGSKTYAMNKLKGIRLYCMDKAFVFAKTSERDFALSMVQVNGVKDNKILAFAVECAGCSLHMLTDVKVSRCPTCSTVLAASDFEETEVQLPPALDEEEEADDDSEAQPENEEEPEDTEEEDEESSDEDNLLGEPDDEEEEVEESEGDEDLDVDVQDVDPNAEEEVEESDDDSDPLIDDDEEEESSDSEEDEDDLEPMDEAEVEESEESEEEEPEDRLDPDAVEESEDDEEDEEEQLDPAKNITVDMLEDTDVDPEDDLDLEYSSSSVHADQARWIVSSKKMPLASCEFSSVSGALAEDFHTDKFGKVCHAVIAKSGVLGLKELGFKSITFETPIKHLIRKQVNAEIAATRTQITAGQSTLVRDFTVAMGIAAVGINKGTLPGANALKANLFEELKTLRIPALAAAKMIDRVFEQSSDEYHTLLIETATDLMSKTPEVRAELSKLIVGTRYTEVSADDLEDDGAQVDEEEEEEEVPEDQQELSRRLTKPFRKVQQFEQASSSADRAVTYDTQLKGVMSRIGRK